MLGFYTDERATDVDLDLDCDMLLFQWGTYDWHQGSGPAFEYNITRQFIDEDVDDDESEGIWQLRLTVFFQPDEENARLRDGDRWLGRRPGLITSPG